MVQLPALKISRADLADLNSFLAVFRLCSFTQAAKELGVTTSALSHSIRNLESRLGVSLLNRTSRTVSPTEAGSSLAKRLEIGFAEIGDALADVNQHRERPAGRLRLNVLQDGARLILAKYLPAYLKKYPDMSVEVSVEDKMVDIIAAGFDAGIRFGGTIPVDLVAVKVSEPLRWVTVASPAYLYRRTAPRVPEDLMLHNCIQMRTGQGKIYRWDFEKEGDHRVIDAPGQVCVNDTNLVLELALAGSGVGYCLESRAAEFLASGQLREVLPDWAPTEPPMYLYYPKQRSVPPGLHELIDMIRKALTS
jgi:DNA-binding transcriptional LysR family regulator